MQASDLDYELPDALVAQHPPARRQDARLLQVACAPTGAELGHGRIDALPSCLPPRSLLVFNDTRVLPARLLARKPSGGRVELLLLHPLQGPAAGEPGPGQPWLAMAKPAKSLKDGVALHIAEDFTATPRGRTASGEVRVELAAPGGVAAALARYGRMPLPPYIQRPADADDADRYQTVFARTPGAVAAPTAGLHFTESLLQALDAAGHERAFVTLHVGPGTFAPLRSEQLADHPMHAERYDVPESTATAIAAAHAAGRPVVAVGTTVVRTLEAAADGSGGVHAGPGQTALFIYPPYRFQVVDALVTNFHLPRSTLLALVMAFAGQDVVRTAYAEAVAAGYRFFSYGDAMLLSGHVGRACGGAA